MRNRIILASVIVAVLCMVINFTNIIVAKSAGIAFFSALVFLLSVTCGVLATPNDD